MRAGVNFGKLLVAIVIAVAIGGGIGYAVGAAANELGWSTGFAGPLTGAGVFALVSLLYQLRARPRDFGE